MSMLNIQTLIVDYAFHSLYNSSSDIVNFIFLVEGGKV
jgi:hypothetical protein